MIQKIHTCKDYNVILVCDECGTKWSLRTDATAVLFPECPSCGKSEKVGPGQISPLSGTLPDDPLDLVVRLREKLDEISGGCASSVCEDCGDLCSVGKMKRAVELHKLITEADRMINSHTTEK